VENYVKKYGAYFETIDDNFAYTLSKYQTFSKDNSDPAYIKYDEIYSFPKLICMDYNVGSSQLITFLDMKISDFKAE